METLGLKSINMLSKEQYENIEQPAHDELYVVSHSGIGFPSANYDDLELGASGTEYIAPANGYFVFGKSATAANQYVFFENTNSTMKLLVYTPASTGKARGVMWARKGEKVLVEYTAAGATDAFKFIYSEGE